MSFQWVLSIYCVLSSMRLIISGILCLIFAASGTDDFTYSAFKEQIMAMGSVSDGTFRFADNEADGNLSFLEREGYVHDGIASDEYTYNGLSFFGTGNNNLQNKGVGSDCDWPPLYWHNICGSARNMLDRFYGLAEEGALSGKSLRFLFQGAAPEKWMMEAGEYTMKRFAGLYGMEYAGMATNRSEAGRLSEKL